MSKKGLAGRKHSNYAQPASTRLQNSSKIFMQLSPTKGKYDVQCSGPFYGSPWTLSSRTSGHQVYSRLGPDYPRQSGSDGGKRREDNKFLILGSGMPPRKLPAGRRLPVTNSLSRWLALFVVCSVMCGRGRDVRVIVTPWKKVGPTGDGLWLVSPTEPSVLWQLWQLEGNKKGREPARVKF